MPRIPHNIETRRSPLGPYRVGYGAGLVWHVTPSTSSFGRWCARAASAPCNMSGNDRSKADRAPLLFAFTLADLGAKLDACTLPD